MRICFFGLYGDENPRNLIFKRGLVDAGVEVVECRGPLRLGDTPSLAPPARTARLVNSLRSVIDDVDAVFVPEFNQALVPLAAAVARRRGIPVVCDFLVSLYDTAVRDRRQGRLRPRSQLLRLADAAALRLATRVVTDTPQHSRYFAADFGPSLIAKMDAIHVGAPEWLFNPSPLPVRGQRPLNVLFYGSFIPLHGAEHIVAAAKLLNGDPRFRFTLVGRGQTLADARRLDAGTAVEFRSPVPFGEIPGLIRNADICLGIFGTTAKAERVVPNKVWQCMAAGRPVITGDNAATRSVFSNGADCILVPHGEPVAIVDAVEQLARSEGHAAKIAAAGASLVHSRFTSAPLARELLSSIEKAARSSP